VHVDRETGHKGGKDVEVTMSEYTAGHETSTNEGDSPLPRFPGANTAEDVPSEGSDDLGESVGASDAIADAIRSGADMDAPDVVRTDSEDVQVGRADADADVRRSGADPADV
jgi:hypothetical protein